MPHLYTIGHSNQDMQSFLKLLEDNDIQIVVDVRSVPYSRYVPEYNRKEIEISVIGAGLKYIFMGDSIGGKPSDPEFLNGEGKPRYDRLSASERFQQGINRLLKGLIEGWRIALMCAEKDPLQCHRHHLIARELELKHNIPVWHIRADNTRLRAKEHLEGGSFQVKLF